MNSLLGLWLFTSILYHGEVQPRPNPHLIMTLNFISDTQNVLKYSRENEDGFCERIAEYSFDGRQLRQKVIATHPANAFYCSQDLDMIVGTQSLNQLEVVSENLLLHLDLGEEKLTYIWTRKKETTK